ncbi:hypothetical protein [Nocardia wallacei]|uniref:hypothetical protein n=1 Tax=Nocardia wallacei TaxID=480035 RepID=UPI0024588DF1|nr:hypothetical protein [Nocardia wallacei]
MDSYSGFSSRSWEPLPPSALDAVQAAFDRIADRPVFVPPDAVAGLAEPRTSWRQLRKTLLDSRLPMATVDAAWVWLIDRHRADAADAAVVCAGMALPMLVSVASWLSARSARWRAEFHDLDSEVVTGFLAELTRIDLRRPWVLHRLRWTVFRHGISCLDEQSAAPIPIGSINCADIVMLRSFEADLASDDDRVAQAVRDDVEDPVSLLAESVACGVISIRAAALIAVTRLQRRPLTVLAAEYAQPYQTLVSQRRRAERRLAAWLAARADGGVDPVLAGEVDVPREALAALGALPLDRTQSEIFRQQVNKSGGKSGVWSYGSTPDPRTPPSPPEEDRKCA